MDIKERNKAVKMLEELRIEYADMSDKIYNLERSLKDAELEEYVGRHFIVEEDEAIFYMITGIKHVPATTHRNECLSFYFVTYNMGDPEASTVGIDHMVQIGTPYDALEIFGTVKEISQEEFEDAFVAVQDACMGLLLDMIGVQFDE